MFDMDAMRTKYQENGGAKRQREEKAAKDEAQFIVEQVRKTLAYGKCIECYRDRYVKTGAFTAAPDCRTGELYRHTDEEGKTVNTDYALMKTYVEEELPHHRILPSGMYDDGPQVEVSHMFFDWDYEELRLLRKQFIEDQIRQSETIAKEISTKLSEEIAKVDDRRCYEAYVKEYEQRGSFGYYGLSECQTDTVQAKPLSRESWAHVNQQVQRVNKFATIRECHDGVYAYITPEQYMKQQ